MNYRNILQKGSLILKKSLILSPQFESELLLSLSLNKSRDKILLNLEENLTVKQIKKYIKLINRRKKKEPISSIFGNKFFWKYEFIVNKNVLAPRFETELMVEEILKIYKQQNNINVLDIGIGSGCILISLLKEKKSWRGTGLDVSKLALNIAKTNAKIQQVHNRIKFINSDVDKFFSNKYDLIVTNPPYINRVAYNNLDLSVKRFEPKQALYGGIDGLRVIEKVIKKSRIILKNRSFLALEIGFGQYFKVKEILNKNGFYLLKVIKDYQNIPRCIITQKIDHEKF